MTTLKTVNIKGKEYVQVNERLKAFRSMPEFKGWSLTSEVVDLKEDSCTIKAIITDNDGKIRATGFAREVIAKSPINKFAFVENCETSAWGRALGNLGIGIDSSICSAEELITKMSQDDNTQDLPDDIREDILQAKSKEELQAIYEAGKNKYKGQTKTKFLDLVRKRKEELMKGEG